MENWKIYASVIGILLFILYAIWGWAGVYKLLEYVGIAFCCIVILCYLWDVRNGPPSE